MTDDMNPVQKMLFDAAAVANATQYTQEMAAEVQLAYEALMKATGGDRVRSISCAVNFFVQQTVLANVIHAGTPAGDGNSKEAVLHMIGVLYDTQHMIVSEYWKRKDKPEQTL